MFLVPTALVNTATGMRAWFFRGREEGCGTAEFQSGRGLGPNVHLLVASCVEDELSPNSIETHFSFHTKLTRNTFRIAWTGPGTRCHILRTHGPIRSLLMPDTFLFSTEKEDSNNFWVSCGKQIFHSMNIELSYTRASGQAEKASPCGIPHSG